MAQPVAEVPTKPMEKLVEILRKKKEPEVATTSDRIMNDIFDLPHKEVIRPKDKSFVRVVDGKEEPLNIESFQDIGATGSEGVVFDSVKQCLLAESTECSEIFKLEGTKDSVQKMNPLVARRILQILGFQEVSSVDKNGRDIKRMEYVEDFEKRTKKIEPASFRQFIELVVGLVNKLDGFEAKELPKHVSFLDKYLTLYTPLPHENLKSLSDKLSIQSKWLRAPQSVPLFPYVKLPFAFGGQKGGCPSGSEFERLVKFYLDELSRRGKHLNRDDQKTVDELVKALKEKEEQVGQIINVLAEYRNVVGSAEKHEDDVSIGKMQRILEEAMKKRNKLEDGLFKVCNKIGEVLVMAPVH